MKHITLLSTCLILFISGCSRDKKEYDDSGWLLKNVKNEFSISLPMDHFEIHNEEYYSENIGKINSHEIDLNTQYKSDANLGYKMTIYEYLEFDFYDSNGKIDQFLLETADNILIAINASRISQKKIEYQGHPGIEMYYIMEGRGTYLTTRMYIIDGKQINLTVITDKKKLLNKSISKFLNSFKIL